jgi:outer membrane protein assembly factor BamB
VKIFPCRFDCLLPVVFLIVAFATPLFAEDWPMWRYDARRGSSSPQELVGELHLQWTRQLEAPMQAWPETQAKLQFDAQAEPVVMGERIFVPSSRYDSMTAFSTRTGEQLWRFFAGGPVRFAPVASDGKVFFNSDDGHLYAVDAESGKLLWKVFGGPKQRWLIGNHRMVSTWPARGGVVLHDGRLFFSAGIWPFMGIFVHAVDPESGKILWTNSGDGSNYSVQPHDAESFAGLVPQGHMAAQGDTLVVPGGRSTPGIYETATGEQRFFNFDKRAGGHDVGIAGDLFFTAGHAYLLDDGTAVGGGAPAIFDDQTLIASDPESVLARAADVEVAVEESVDRKGKKVREMTARYRELFQSKLDKEISGHWFLRAGSRYYSGGDGVVAAYEKGKGKVQWQAKVAGKVVTMLAADDRLFALTDENVLHCFGEETVNEVVARELPGNVDGVGEVSKLGNLLKREGTSHGFALCLGIGSGEAIGELLRETELHVIALDGDAAELAAIRSKMADAGFYGERFSAIQGDPATIEIAPYFANLIVVVEGAGSLAADKNQLARVFEWLRPYGGQLCLKATVEAAGLANAKVESVGEYSLVIREGALAGSDDWTHQYANAAQTVVSRDSNVKAPFGVLWFGGPSHAAVLPRHGHGPSPQVAGGRLFIEGPDMLRAVDVYTGRLMWQRELKGIGEYYDTTAHFAGAGEIGSNYVSMPDRVYTVLGREILMLDAATGKTVKAISANDDGEPSYWGHISVSGDFLIASSSPIAADKDDKAKDKNKDLPVTKYASGSRHLAVFDRRSGEKLWSRQAAFNFRHNNIAVGEDRVFCIDRLSDERSGILTRRGLEFEGKPTMYALDLKSGEVLWQRSEGVFGTFLNYSAELDLVLQGGSAYRDRASDEVRKGLMALRGKDGELLWNQPDLEYSGPCLLWRDRILTNGSSGFALDANNGEKTGWIYTRMYGCNTAVGSEHLMTFRSGAAGFFDLANDSGTGNLGGFKSSCTNNLIPANGVLNAPDYTRTCTCSYQNQTSLALVHMPEAEYWTFGGKGREGRIGINFGAPGDRRSDEGTLFVDFPEVGGKSEKVDFEVKGENLAYHRQHASLFEGEIEQLPWVAASQVEGIESLSVAVPDGVKACRVRLFFAELDGDAAAGGRVFDVEVGDKEVLVDFDVARLVGGRCVLVKEMEITPKAGQVEIEFKRHEGSLPATLSGVEIVY